MPPLRRVYILIEGLRGIEWVKLGVRVASEPLWARAGAGCRGR